MYMYATCAHKRYDMYLHVRYLCPCELDVDAANQNWNGMCDGAVNNMRRDTRFRTRPQITGASMAFGAVVSWVGAP